MKNFKEKMITLVSLDEAAYPNNMGFAEMVTFYQTANSAQIAEMEKIIKNADWDAFKKLIRAVVGIKLK